MKTQLIIISIIFLQLITLTSFGQTLYTKSDTIHLEQDSVVLKIDEYRGQIQWQKSKSTEVWEDIEGANVDSLFLYDIDSSRFYRVKITDGNCDPVFSDSTYVLRELTEEDEAQLISDAGTIKEEVAFYAPDSTNTVINYTDTTGNTNIVTIKTSAPIDSVKPGWLLVDTTGLGQIIYVTDYVEEKSGGNVINKIIEGVQVGIDFLITDQELSYSSPTNRTKNWWNNPLKLDNEGKVKKVGFKSYLQGMEETVEKEYLQLDFSGTELWNIEEDGSHLNITIEEGYLKYNPAIDFYSIYTPGAVATAALGSAISLPSVLAKSDYIVKGMLDELKIITYNDFDFRVKLNIDASLEKDLSDLIKPTKIAHFWYSIPAGPIIISVKTDLIARLTFEASGDLNIQPEYEIKKNLVLGVNVIEEDNKFKREFIYDHHAEKSSSTSYDGNFNLYERLEIVPSIEIYVMGMIGADGELITYQEFNLNASISNEHPLIFDTSLDIGVDGHASFDLSAFHFDKATAELFKGNWEISEKKNLYHAPSKLSYYSGNGQTGQPNSQLGKSLKVKVLDSNNNPLNNFPVFFDVTSGGGSLANPTPKSNSSGNASTNWTLGTNGQQKVKARLTKADITQTVGEVDFTATLNNSTAPTVITDDATAIAETSATLNGNVTSDGGSTITQRGFYWSKTNSAPTTNDNIVTVSGTTGSYNKSIANLEPNTTYYFCAFATNSQGTSKAGVKSFKSREEQGGETGIFTDSRDGKSYNWVKIGNQTWMAENLAYLPYVNPPSAESYTEPFYYVYGYSGTDVAAAKATPNFSTYGVLYNWQAAKAACPTGWHLPSSDESAALTTFLDGSVAGGKMKEAGTVHWSSPNTSATNESGFSGLPGGLRHLNGSFDNIGYYGFWWSSNEINTDGARCWFLGYDYAGVNLGILSKEYGYSVRCIRD